MNACTHGQADQRCRIECMETTGFGPSEPRELRVGIMIFARHEGRCARCGSEITVGERLDKTTRGRWVCCGHQLGETRSAGILR